MADDKQQIDADDILHLTTDIVSAYVSNNKSSADEIPQLLEKTFAMLTSLRAGGDSEVTNKEPAVPVSKSITPDFIICLEDGKKLKMLKRYLRTQYDLTPEEYRRKWNLPADYPMVAPNYAKKRSAFAKKIGLGKAAGTATPTKKTTRKRATKKKA
ncbi:MucR family transcriptional regulator [Aquisalinus flavus]|uniref:MucR family transcriptional regulator n=1 Tax=Aquisalinus flavus TaxID=1526572 RepID=A0A8J2V4N6_9PROT|nr:MucR family transcriptional regulator [Aquisalinus flavus]MBD0427690.1 MucR family transcriptional regulator [Aquisalinus flavus]UNE47470.1 transcriptional regulator [Aquisalinus flavus]GGD03038.1 MucR family transcriptional regulator [Aquisalinus flavus]